LGKKAFLVGYKIQGYLICAAMKTKLLLLLVLLVPFFIKVSGQGIIIDHNCLDVSSIPANIIDSVKSQCKFEWAGASHAHQVLTGLKLLEGDIPELDVTVGDGETGYSSGGYLPDPNGTFCVMDGVTIHFAVCGQCCMGIQPNGYWQGDDAKVSIEKTLVQCFPDINVSGWVWCTQLNTWTETQVQEYLNEMQYYEDLYPDVVFIYATSTTEYTGDGGHNRWLRNNQIREHCIQNDKVLFDFADLECWSDGEFSYYIHNNDTVPTRHPDYSGDEHHHTNALNCKNKGKAIWYLMALLSGWQQNTTNNPPQIDNQSFNINENSPNGQLVGIIIATDPDAGQSITYSIIDGNINGAFQINSTSGELTVANGSALNFEGHPSFQLTVQVEDDGQGNLTDQAYITVDLLDVNENPVIEDQTFDISENSANGQSIGIILATDPDAGQSLTYSIIDGNTNSAFQINPTSGELTVANSTILDFESFPSFQLTVLVEDDGQGNLTDQANITVNLLDVNENPVIEDQTFEIDENSANGQLVEIILATDPDAGQSLTYSIIDGNTSGAFQINSTLGELTVANGSALDFESIPTFQLTVLVEDNGQGNLTDQATITVNLIDLNENPVIENQSFYINENAENGQLVGGVVAIDPDNGQVLTFSIESGNIDDAFLLNQLSGELFVNNSEVFDFETMPVFNLIILVEDNGQGNLSDQGAITINLQDMNEPPVIEPQDLFANIDSYIVFGDINYNFQSAGIVQAFDPDEGQSIEFSIASGNEREIWNLDETTGEITLVDPYRLNIVQDFSYSLMIEVRDNSPQQLLCFAEVVVYVHLENLPDNVEYITSLSESTIGNRHDELACNIFPNPSSSSITLEVNGNVKGIIEISIFTLNGEAVIEKEILNETNLLRENLDVSSLDPGLYLICIQKDGVVLFEKFTRQ